MMPLLFTALAAVAAAPEVAVTVAPDQPAPHIYLGDPLILEFVADRDCVISVEVEIRPAFSGDTVVALIEGIRLKAYSQQWRTVDEAPDLRGRYFLTVRFNSPEGIRDHTGVFCRIDRPGGETAPLPVCAAVNGGTRLSQRLALRTAGVRSVRVDIKDEKDFAKVEAVLEDSFRVIARLLEPAPALCESAARQFHDRVYGWQIDCTGAVEAAAAAAKALRAGGTRSPIAVAVPDAETVAALLETGLGRTVDAVALGPGAGAEDVRQARQAAERAGYERLGLQAHIAASAGQQAHEGPLLARHGMELTAAGASFLVFDAPLVTGDALGPAFVYLDAIAHRLAGATRVGRLPVDTGAAVYVFRVRDRWVAAVWAEAEEVEVSLPAEGAVGLELYDGRNNPLPCPPVDEGAITLKAGLEPVFLTGKGGPLLKDAALAVARKEALAFCESEDVRKHLAKEAVEVVDKFAGDEPFERIDFLNLLQVFPYLEQEWHTGSAPRRVAVPALAGLSRLARALCVVEHEKGQPFVEPLQGTLAACGQYQSLYLTGSAGPDDGRERPDWLLGEVSRLMAEAETLAEEGRDIEASAVGALALRRAQALELAATAKPLSVPEPEPQQAEQHESDSEEKEEK